MNTIYQVSLLQSLTDGLYDGIIDVATLKSFSNTAIGTFLGADGEMIMVDGVCYKANLDGSIIEAKNSETIPFCNACTFIKCDGLKLSCSNINDLKNKLHEYKNNKFKNLIMVIKIEGLFSSMTTRSLPKQNKPYKPLDYIVEHEQKVITNKNIEGTIIGFCAPTYMSNLNTTDFHMHFISKNKLVGGHILDLSFENLNIDVSIKSEFKLILSSNNEFINYDIKNNSEKIKKVEE